MSQRMPERPFELRFCCGRVQTKASMFRQIPQEALGSSVMSVKVNVLPASPPDPALKEDIDNIEFQRYDQEKRMFESEVLALFKSNVLIMEPARFVVGLWRDSLPHEVHSKRAGGENAGRFIHGDIN